MSHIIVAKLIGNVKSWTIKPYPNKSADGRWRFASANWTWDGEKPSQGKLGLISLAPRVTGFIAVELVLITFFLTGIAKMLLLIFCAAGVVDMIVGSIGKSPFSDLKVAAKKLGINPWKIRVAGFATSLMGVTAIIASLL